MTTSTLLLIVGGVVCLKTVAFVGLWSRRGRRQRSALRVGAEALAAAKAVAPVPVDPPGWRLQWAEPGVLLVENINRAEAARDVGLSASLTSGSGTVASVEQAVRFVGTGACFKARFAAVDPWLTASTLSYSMAWRTPEGERRRETRTVRSVVPAPDLAFEAA